jgi:hypothetical protein
VLLALLLLSTQHHHDAMTSSWRAEWHGTAFVQYLHTFETRGTYQFGSVNRVMAEAGGPAAGGDVRFEFMGSIEPLTLTERGAPQLLQGAFHTSDGTTITDRAHPSPWIMALAASYERALSKAVAVSLYGAAIGEPALGPPVYLHRASAEANSVVPLGHHLQDDTHSSYGVITAGLRWQTLHLEASAFNERQPEGSDHVFYYKGARLDAYATRATVAVGAWSLFGTYGYLPEMTGGHAHGAQHRIGAGAIRTSPTWQMSFVYGANDPIGGAGPRRSLLAEAQRHWRGGDVFFTRAEFVQRTAEELELVGSINTVQDVGALQLGYGREVMSRGRVSVRVAAHGTVHVVTPQLEPFYGSRAPLALGAHAQVSW